MRGAWAIRLSVRGEGWVGLDDAQGTGPFDLPDLSFLIMACLLRTNVRGPHPGPRAYQARCAV